MKLTVNGEERVLEAVEGTNSGQAARPLHMVLQFSAELENRLKGKVSPSLFATRDRDEFSRC